MDSTVIVAIIGGAVTIFNVIFSTVMANKGSSDGEEGEE